MMYLFLAGMTLMWTYQTLELPTILYAERILQGGGCAHIRDARHLILCSHAAARCTISARQHPRQPGSHFAHR